MGLRGCFGLTVSMHAIAIRSGSLESGIEDCIPTSGSLEPCMQIYNLVDTFGKVILQNVLFRDDRS